MANERDGQRLRQTDRDMDSDSTGTRTRTEAFWRLRRFGGFVAWLVHLHAELLMIAGNDSC